MEQHPEPRAAEPPAAASPEAFPDSSGPRREAASTGAGAGGAPAPEPGDRTSLPAPAAAPVPEGAPPPDGYDPADYRWVPVRRRPRLDGWTEEKQRRFIEVLADTGLVSVAARAVGMSRESAYRLRRSAHGAAFARAWDAARDHSGGVIEDIAFERALEGVEQNVFDENGEVVCTKRVYNDRLLMFLLRHLKPERYGAAAAARSAAEKPSPADVETTLRAMEPRLPAAPEALLGRENFSITSWISPIAPTACCRASSPSSARPSPRRGWRRRRGRRRTRAAPRPWPSRSGTMRR